VFSPNIEKLIIGIHSTLPRLQRFYWNSHFSKEKELLGDLHCALQSELDFLADQYTLHCGPIPAPKLYVEYSSIRDVVEYIRDQAFYARCDNKSIMKAIDSIYNIIMHARYKLELINTNQE
jgi:hypothetical protein